MRVFPVPFDKEVEDKFIGGYLTIKQFIPIVLGLLPVKTLLLENDSHVIYDGVVEIGKSIPILSLKILICAITVTLGIVVGLVKIKGYDIPDYIVLKYKFKNRLKKYGYMKQFR